MKITAGQKKYFTKQLMQWHSVENTRSLPWKDEKNPYKIWLSEIILQQTRAQQGLPYYLNFIKTYPIVKALADADDEEVFRLWQGLGYYNRCKNMLATARYIANELNGIFPNTYEKLLELKGIGPYTAAAISSFAFGRPHAVVDGNVYRVLSRFFGIDIPFDSQEGKKAFSVLAQELLFPDDSAAYNQAIMDMGATICTPQIPKCDSCPLYKNCIGYKQEITELLPLRSKKITVRKRFFHYLLFIVNDKIWIHKRTGRDIWENLHEPFLIENEYVLSKEGIIVNENYKKLKINSTEITYEGLSHQKLTHQFIETHFFIICLKAIQKIPIQNGEWIDRKDLKKLAFPKTVLSFLEKKLYF